MRIKISEIAYHLPDEIETNEELSTANPEWDLKRVESRTGVLSRHIAGNDETAFDLAFSACEKLFKANPSLKNKIDGIVFCTQNEDYVMPANSSVLHDKLGLKESVFALDFNLACSGYIYGLAMIRGLFATGMVTNVILVNADTYSRYIHPKDRSARLLFGDGAAVSWIEASSGDEGIIDVICSTSGAHHQLFMIPAGGSRTPRSDETQIPAVDVSGNVRTPEHIRMDGGGVLEFVKSRVPDQIYELLERNGLSLSDIDQFVFHQASKTALDTLARLLDVGSDRIYSNIEKIGNTVSASIPIALRDAQDEGKIKSGDLVLLCGFGVGLSWGSALVRV
jgi:3-oxoacyl-[acyl-carrier-protein] synthase-3